MTDKKEQSRGSFVYLVLLTLFWLGRLSLVVLVVLAICVLYVIYYDLLGVSVQTHGDATIYTAADGFEKNLFIMISYVIPITISILAAYCLLLRGFLRFYGAVLGSMAVWALYTLATGGLDFSNQHVTVTPTGILREAGSKSKPIRYQIDFTNTIYLEIDEVPDEKGPTYELVAYATPDGTETRIPINDTMRAAIPQIIETAVNHRAVISESLDGWVNAPALQNDNAR